MRTALVVGGSGLVGRHLVDRLAADLTWERVVSLGRRPLGRQDIVDRVVDFDQIDGEQLPTSDALFCSLGTTIKKAGSEEAFRRVDLEYVVASARAVFSAGCRQFLMVSSIGADPATSNFYLSVKGEAEAAVRQIGFDSVQIFRPSLLLGARSESRPAERIGQIGGRIVARLMLGPLERYRAVRAETVAAAMVAAARQPQAGVRVHTHREFRDLVERVG